MFFPLIFMEFQVAVNSVVFCSAKKPTTLLTVTILLTTTLLTVESIKLLSPKKSIIAPGTRPTSKVDPKEIPKKSITFVCVFSSSGNQ